MWDTLKQRGWVDDRDVWRGPGKGKRRKADPFGGKGKGGGKSSDQDSNADPFGGKATSKGQGKRKGKPSEYDMLRDDPEVWMNMAGNPLPCALFALELACDREDFDYNGNYTRRVWGTRRHAQRLYQKRHFETDVHEAIISKNLVYCLFF